MSKSLEEAVTAALQLSHQDRDRLLQRLIAGFQVGSQAYQDAVVAAWGGQATQAIAQWDGGRNAWLSVCVNRRDAPK